MDSVTHIVTGAALGELLLGKRVGNKAMLWGAIAGSLPDIDVVFSPLLDTVDELVYHRGFTHSIVFVLLISPILGFALSRLYKKEGVPWIPWGMLVLVNMVVHILLDCFTTWGTQVFWPLPYRVEIKNIFVIDPLFTLPLLISVIWIFFYRRGDSRRSTINKVGLVLAGSYMIFTFGNKLYMNWIFDDQLRLQGIEVVQYETKPTPLNNILWSVTAETSEGYYIGFYSHFDSAPDTPYYYFPKNHYLLEPVLHERDVQRLLFMTKGFFTVEETPEGLLLNDLRFGQASGWHTGEGDFVFAYFINREPDGQLKITQRINSFRDGREMLPHFWNRIKGV